MADVIPALSERFWKRVNKHGPIPEHRPDLGPCWLWTGALNRAGYGERIEIRSDRDYPHRFAYRAAVGPISDELELDHLCRIRHCVRSAHLEAVTHAENQRRMAQMMTHCKRGHPLSGDNLRINPGTGHRVCRACNRAAQERFRGRVERGERVAPPSWVERKPLG